jgi:hypothetical protein
LEVSITPWSSSGSELTRTHIPENKNRIAISLDCSGPNDEAVYLYRRFQVF